VWRLFFRALRHVATHQRKYWMPDGVDAAVFSSISLASAWPARNSLP